jgi:hypothetical protein
MNANDTANARDRERWETPTAPAVPRALDYARFETIAELSETAASYWRFVTLAAMRGERLTVETHCRQLALVTREAFQTVKALGSEAVDVGGAE